MSGKIRTYGNPNLGLPPHGSPSKLSQPHLNLFVHLAGAEYEGAETPVCSETQHQFHLPSDLSLQSTLSLV